MIIRFFKIIPFLHFLLLILLVSRVYSPQEVDISTKVKTPGIFLKHSNPGLCGIKKLLSKAIVRYRAKVFLPDAIHSRSHKSDSTLVAKIFFAQPKGLKCVALNIKCDLV